MSLPQSNTPNPIWDGTTSTHTTTTLNRPSATTVTTTKLPTSIQPAITTSIAGRTTSSVSPSHGGTTLYRYDALVRNTGTKQPRHTAYSKIEYNTAGQITKTTDAAGNATTYQYYANGELGAGQLRLTTDAIGGTVFKQYDLAGNETYTWGSATYPVAQAYDIYGQHVLLLTFRDTNTNFAGTAFPLAATGDTTTWSYDEATGVLLQKTYADGKGPSYDYYADGRLKTRLWARLNPATGTRLATNYTYTPQGQLAHIDYADDTPDVTVYVEIEAMQLDYDLSDDVGIKRSKNNIATTTWPTAFLTIPIPGIKEIKEGNKSCFELDKEGGDKTIAGYVNTFIPVSAQQLSKADGMEYTGNAYSGLIDHESRRREVVRLASEAYLQEGINSNLFKCSKLCACTEKKKDKAKEKILEYAKAVIKIHRESFGSFVSTQQNALTSGEGTAKTEIINGKKIATGWPNIWANGKLPQPEPVSKELPTCPTLE